MSDLTFHRLEADSYDRVYVASIAVLRDYGFRVDRQDYRFGRVTTHPLSSPTIFEPWHPHNSTSEQVWHSTFLHLHRRVTIFIDPDDRGETESTEEVLEQRADTRPHGTALNTSDYLLRVEVLLESRQLPTRRLIGSAAGRVFSQLKTTPTEWVQRGITQQYWLPISRDLQLEARLIHEILHRVATAG